MHLLRSFTRWSYHIQLGTNVHDFHLKLYIGDNIHYFQIVISLFIFTLFFLVNLGEIRMVGVVDH